MTQHITLAAGIDTGKRALDIALSTGGAGLKVDNDPAGHDRLADWLARAGVVRVGIEASGGYERAVVDHLRGAGFELVRLQQIPFVLVTPASLGHGPMPQPPRRGLRPG